MPLTKSFRFTQTMSSLLQLPHCGETSSHFFLRARHVRQPEFDFSLPIEVSGRPPTVRYSEAFTCWPSKTAPAVEVKPNQLAR
jgi:hypothetical protein